MKIAILGAGAMGMLFGGYLAQHNDVWLVGTNAERTQKIDREGILIHEKEELRHCFPHAVTDTSALGTVDLVLIFVKAYATETALQANRGLIGKDTFLMTLQNGAGHEAKLQKYADAGHVIIGSTQHNSSIVGSGEIRHGGSGLTSIGLPGGDSELLAPIAEAFTACGLDTVISQDVKKQIWKKLLTNTAMSALTAVLQVPMGYIVSNDYAHELMCRLLHEAVEAAKADGVVFDEDEERSAVETVCRNGPNGFTSIYADVKKGNRTEVDTISGSVVETAKRLGVEVPYHEMLVLLIHALEQR